MRIKFESEEERVEHRKKLQNYRMETNRKAFFDGKECARCGSKINLELDHIDPSTKISHRIWSSSQKVRYDELIKCQALCRICHREKSARESSRPIKHGTTSGYRKGCRCVACKEDHRIAAVIYAEKKRREAKSLSQCMP